ncbi:hypothetical protein PROFUN_10652 [Planoprotostelium fungivorum]|uniref:SAP domain-containing protein n=1 Tax=Planoprotostelium fungivorum TaxID=1890364 RepID=A0A2P6MUV9_9EUKA|nr:hypothetical protein PROFUN_10652 [Planoprotostelium fungivorum]
MNIEARTCCSLTTSYEVLYDTLCHGVPSTGSTHPCSTREPTIEIAQQSLRCNTPQPFQPWLLLYGFSCPSAEDKTILRLYGCFCPILGLIRDKHSVRVEKCKAVVFSGGEFFGADGKHSTDQPETATSRQFLPNFSQQASQHRHLNGYKHLPHNRCSRCSRSVPPQINKQHMAVDPITSKQEALRPDCTTDLNDLSIPALKERCHQRGLQISGSHSTLISRLTGICLTYHSLKLAYKFGFLTAHKKLHFEIHWETQKKVAKEMAILLDICAQVDSGKLGWCRVPESIGGGELTP